MPLPLNTTLTVSCDQSEEDSGPTIVHSAGFAGYRVPPDAIRILQEAFSNDQLCDDQSGVRCFVQAASVIQAFQNVGFEVINENVSNGRKVWTIKKTS